MLSLEMRVGLIIISNVAIYIVNEIQLTNKIITVIDSVI